MMAGRYKEMFEKMQVDALIYGHSHFPESRLYNGVLFFCPGFAGEDMRDPGRAVGILTISDGKISGEITVDFEEDGKSEKLSVGQLQNKFNRPERAIRQKAFAKFEEAWETRASLAASALNYQGGFRLSLYKHRGWKSVLHEPLRVNRMEEATLDAMWRNVATALPDMRKYIYAKKRFLGIDKFQLGRKAAAETGLRNCVGLFGKPHCCHLRLVLFGKACEIPHRP
jgi:hypothetical protein